MQSYVNIRTEHWDAGITPQQRREIVSRKVRALSDDDLILLAVPRDKKHPGRGLRPMSISLPTDVLERLERCKGPHWSMSALIDRLLDDFVLPTEKPGVSDE